MADEEEVGTAMIKGDNLTSQRRRQDKLILAWHWICENRGLVCNNLYMNKVALHQIAVRNISSLLARYGHRPTKAALTKGRFDILLDGKLRLEVKTARPSSKKAMGHSLWRVNIHRHGKLPNQTPPHYKNGFEKEPHFVIIALSGVPDFTAAIYFSIPYDEIKNSPTLSISLRSILSTWNRYVDPGLKTIRAAALRCR